MQRSETPSFWSSGVRRWTAAVIVAALVALISFLVVSGLGASETAVIDDDSPARVEPIGSSGLNNVTLSEVAAGRLDITTSPVRRLVVNGSARLVLPYSGVVYDADGASWVYETTAPLRYVRHRVDVADVVGADAVLASGPPVGTEVVSVGAEELFGTEFEFDEE